MATRRGERSSSASPIARVQLDPDGVGALRAYLDQFWNRALAAFKTAVEQRDDEVS
jgi:hypothetical protein